MPQAAVPFSALGVPPAAVVPSMSDDVPADSANVDPAVSSMDLESHRPALMRRGRPEDNLSGLDIQQLSGKRALSGGDISRKRQKITLGEDHVSPKDAAAPISRPLDGSNRDHSASSASLEPLRKHTGIATQLNPLYEHLQGLKTMIESDDRTTTDPGSAAGRSNSLNNLTTTSKSKNNEPYHRKAGEGENIRDQIEKVFNHYKDQDQSIMNPDLATSSKPDEMSQNNGKSRDSRGHTMRQMNAASHWGNDQDDTSVQRRLVRARNSYPNIYSRNLDGNPYRVEDVLGGLMLPGHYEMTKAVGTGMPWVCPIRSCPSHFKRKTTLGKHWKKKHRKCLLNDNNDGTFSIKGQYRPKTPRKENALVISQEPSDPFDAPVAPPLELSRSLQPNTANSQCNVDVPREAEFGKEPAAEAPPNASVTADAESVTYFRPGLVMISDDLEMATNFRAYNTWPDHAGNPVKTAGALLPANYRLCGYPDFEWICPVRSCRCATKSIEALSNHFERQHSFALFNDNRDGTFTEIGHHTGGRAPIIKSKNPIDPIIPMKEPNVDPGDIRLQHDFAASRALWCTDQLKRLLANKPLEKVRTVDEVMAEGGNAEDLKIMENAPQSIQRSLLSTPTPEPSLPDSEVSSNASSEDMDDSEKVYDKEAVNGAEATHERGAPNPAKQESKTSDMTTTAVKENWATIEALFTGKKFPPPQSDPMRTLLSLPRVRELEFPTSQMFSVAWPKDVSLLIVQLVGEESPEPCNRCAKGSGIFKGCVMVSDNVAQATQQGSCTCVNCAWKSCNLGVCDLRLKLREREREREQAADEQTSSPLSDSQPSIRTQDKDGHSDVVENGSEDRLRSLRARRSERLLTEKQTKNDEKSRPQPTSHDDVPPATAPTQPRAVAPEEHSVEVQETGVGASAAASNMANGSRSVQVDERFTFGTHIISPGASLQLDVDSASLRTCTLAVGKVTVKVHGEPAFRTGIQGMFKIMPGRSGEVVNTSGMDAILHVYTMRLGR